MPETPSPELFDQPPKDGGVYQKLKTGQYVRIASATKPAPIGATHAERRQGAIGPCLPSHGEG